jgi:hypothetical protein
MVKSSILNLVLGGLLGSLTPMISVVEAVFRS